MLLTDPTWKGIAQQSGVYVPFSYFASILYALPCEKMDNLICLL